MKLSEAIREGSRGTRQCFFSYGLLAMNEFCAIGAALNHIGVFDKAMHELSRADGGWAALYKYFPNSSSEALCPVGDICDYTDNNNVTTVLSVAGHLNDKHKWSREAIAEWVEVQENLIESRNKQTTQRLRDDSRVGEERLSPVEEVVGCNV